MLLCQSHLRVTKWAGVVKRNQTPVIPGVHISPRLKQVVHHVFPPKTWDKIREFKVEREEAGGEREETDGDKLLGQQQKLLNMDGL